MEFVALKRLRQTWADAWGLSPIPRREFVSGVVGAFLMLLLLYVLTASQPQGDLIWSDKQRTGSGQDDLFRAMSYFKTEIWRRSANIPPDSELELEITARRVLKGTTMNNGSPSDVSGGNHP